MRILEVRDMTSSIASNISNAYIDFSKMTCSVVAVITDQFRNGEQIVGYGFNSNGRYSASGLLRERFIPRINSASPKNLITDKEDNLDPFKIWDILMQNEKPGGHGERSVAVGTIDMAIWDAVAKIADKPLFRHLAEHYNDGKSDEKVWVYAAGGYYYPGKNKNALQDELQSYRDLGYKTLKMKIGAASLQEDMARIESALKISGDGNLCVDANGRFDLELALTYAKQIKQYDLFWFEEAGDPLDFELQSQLATRYELPLATGENLFSHQDARNLIRYGGLRKDRDWLQFDCALSYGLVEYLRTLKMLDYYGWSRRRVVPHGGHQMSLNMAAGLGLGGNESYPHVFKPFCGFADGITIEDGYVQLPEIPGIGFELKSELFSVMRQLID
ncbi:mandelate racemase/muconate lactonizing enzyme family protein [Rhodospirillaceae bacterium]|jgi:L-alanine-DL-glutamate epimerase-like enolase superfamily enzyme|nr:mandelate racemase/muconate lactonizing enzyme family protein [Rhodospirillaceae bacterium]|tara:strand:+ start:641 stop:1804 length:1164 start_codon:yes stop_codon:yes gene_type:complete